MEAGASITVAVDAMGGDHGPRVTVPAAFAFLESTPGARIVLVGQQQTLAGALVKEGVAHACVSAGNTGALMAIARFVLKTLPGIDRPAIASQLPTRFGDTLVLDLGANVNCTPQHLVQFAAMGSALVSAIDGIE